MIINKNVDLSPLTTLRVGGFAKYIANIRSEDDLKEALLISEEANIPVFVLGGGSNVLISDSGFGGIVLKIELLGKIFEERNENVFVTVSAGEDWDTFVKETVAKSLWGIENLSGIPGSIGATPIQNVGAYGVEVSDIIEWVEIYDKNERLFKKLNKIECEFSYRSSLLKEESNFIVTRVCFKLSKNKNLKCEYKDVNYYLKENKIKNPSISDMRKAILYIRSNKFPNLSKVGTAGSFFKNPIITKEEFNNLRKAFEDLPGFDISNGCVKVPLAWILEELGWKDVKKGNVGTFIKQPLVLVAYKNATANEIISFAKEIKEDIKDKTGINIYNEVTFV